MSWSRAVGEAETGIGQRLGAWSTNFSVDPGKKLLTTLLCCNSADARDGRDAVPYVPPGRVRRQQW